MTNEIRTVITMPDGKQAVKMGKGIEDTWVIVDAGKDTMAAISRSHTLSTARERRAHTVPVRPKAEEITTEA